ncbi:hypothetical protein V6N11_042252 [Hibiscus sabdariffa]|uniref:non-specific serine/threonine protein kinase n=1 Tax=Hibiscus sabdariffa TaxID=183260 RepID=A0ABR2QVV4_9ROSI
MNTKLQFPSRKSFNRVLEHNHFSGNLPAALGNLPKIERLFLNSNNFTGELPQTFARLTTLKEFRIGDNNLTGKIPSIFQNWTEIEQIHIVASGLSGTIPDFDSLGSLKELIITYLKGSEATFPKLNNLSNLEILVLRSCNLIGELPKSLESFTNLQTLDLSYNNFTNTGVEGCNRDGLLVVFSSNTYSTVVPYTSALHSLYINCGGAVTNVGNITYEADPENKLPSIYYRSPKYWAFSSTGIFLNGENNKNNFVTKNENLSRVVGELYTDARLSPSSLTYYAFCLHNAMYNVSLHFAEIQFTDDQNFSSLGRRIFDVYIQGKQELKDFNIMDEAGGARKPLVQNFTANVSDGTLEIRLRWAGKGTTVIPVREVYGPLISAISVFDPVYKTRSERGDGISAAAEVGIVAAAIFVTSLIVGGILWWTGCLRRRSTLERDLKGIELQTTSFTLRQIKAATNNFDAANKIGEGGFGPVYKAHKLKEKAQLLDLIDPRIASDYNAEEAMVMINVALLCTNPTAEARPPMSSVVSMLEGRASVPDILADSDICTSEFDVEKRYAEIEENDAGSDSQTKSMLADGQWTSSSDLYPVSLTSSYWQNRDSSTRS